MYRHDWVSSLSLSTLMRWRRKWQPTPVFLPRESQGRGNLVGCCLWVAQSRTRLKWLSSSSSSSRVIYWQRLSCMVSLGGVQPTSSPLGDSSYSQVLFLLLVHMFPIFLLSSYPTLPSPFLLILNWRSRFLWVKNNEKAIKLKEWVLVMCSVPESVPFLYAQDWKKPMDVGFFFLAFRS